MKSSKDQGMDVIGERTLEIELPGEPAKKTILVRLGKPEEHPRGPGSPRTKSTAPIQAR